MGGVERKLLKSTTRQRQKIAEKTFKRKVPMVYRLYHRSTGCTTGWHAVPRPTGCTTYRPTDCTTGLQAEPPADMLYIPVYRLYHVPAYMLYHRSTRCIPVYRLYHRPTGRTTGWHAVSRSTGCTTYRPTGCTTGLHVVSRSTGCTTDIQYVPPAYSVPLVYGLYLRPPGCILVLQVVPLIYRLSPSLYQETKSTCESCRRTIDYRRWNKPANAGPVQGSNPRSLPMGMPLYSVCVGVLISLRDRAGLCPVYWNGTERREYLFKQIGNGILGNITITTPVYECLEIPEAVLGVWYNITLIMSMLTLIFAGHGTCHNSLLTPSGPYLGDRAESVPGMCRMETLVLW